jgi:hypothetical protein
MEKPKASMHMTLWILPMLPMQRFLTMFCEIWMGKHQVRSCLLWTPVFVRYLIDLTPQWDLFVLTGFGWLS